MAKQYEGPVFKTPKGRMGSKSATGFTRVDDYGMTASRPLTHGDSPLTMATDKSNWGVSNDGPTSSVERADGTTTRLPAKRGGWSTR